MAFSVIALCFLVCGCGLWLVFSCVLCFVSASVFRSMLPISMFLISMSVTQTDDYHQHRKNGTKCTEYRYHPTETETERERERENDREIRQHHTIEDTTQCNGTQKTWSRQGTATQHRGMHDAGCMGAGVV